ncbi:DUF1646 family protein [Stetteria hydrogenophila]
MAAEGSELMLEVMRHVPENPQLGVVAGLGLILLLVLFLPFKSSKVERNLEPFFLVMGLLALAIDIATGVIRGGELVKAIFKSAAITPLSISGLPIGITQVVFLAGLAFYFFNRRLQSMVNGFAERWGLPVLAFTITFVLGSVSSLISVIVAAVILAEVAAVLRVERRAKIEFVVIASFALGLGAALTPVGEPLSTIVISKLGAPFDYLFRLLGAYILPALLALSLYAAYRMRGVKPAAVASSARSEGLREVALRAVKVYMFVAALELLGTSLVPLTVWYFSRMPEWMLYWVNTVSAVVDNATLAAAEISPLMTPEQVRSALMSLLISGGMLIPGNIPNIVAAGRLEISAEEWARVGVPIGVALLIVFFIVLHVLGIHVSL